MRLEGGAELLLTEMSDRELLDLVKLYVHAAQETLIVKRGSAMGYGGWKPYVGSPSAGKG